MSLLELRGVHTHIGIYHVLHGVDLVAPKGQLTMLVGRNGAGKTTTLRTIMGLWKVKQGRISFGGEDVSKLSTPQIAGLGIAYVPETMGIFADLTVGENISAFPSGGKILGLSGRQALRRAEADACGCTRDRRAAGPADR